MLANAFDPSPIASVLLVVGFAIIIIGYYATRATRGPFYCSHCSREFYTQERTYTPPAYCPTCRARFR